MLQLLTSSLYRLSKRHLLCVFLLMIYICSLPYRSTLELLELPHLETLRAWQFMCPPVAHSQGLTGPAVQKHTPHPPPWGGANFGVIYIPESPKTVITLNLTLGLFLPQPCSAPLLPDCFLLGALPSRIDHWHMNLHLRFCFWGQD